MKGDKDALKKTFVVMAVLLCALPVGAGVTFLLTPLWRWIEAEISLESIGHSGPAPWCFLVVYAFVVFAAMGGLIWNWIRQSRAEPRA